VVVVAVAEHDPVGHRQVHAQPGRVLRHQIGLAHVQQAGAAVDLDVEAEAVLGGQVRRADVVVHQAGDAPGGEGHYRAESSSSAAESSSSAAESSSSAAESSSSPAESSSSMAESSSSPAESSSSMAESSGRDPMARNSVPPWVWGLRSRSTFEKPTLVACSGSQTRRRRGAPASSAADVGNPGRPAVSRSS